MRRLSIFAILLILIFGGLWLGGETLLTHELRKLSEKDPKVEIGAVTELREFQRIGVHLADIELQTSAGLLSLPMTELWLSPTHLTEGRLTLPTEAVLNTPAGPKTLGLGSADASLRLRPLSGLTLGSLALNSGAMTIEGSELTKGLRVSAELGRLGHGAPLGALAAYDLDIAIDEFDPTPLAPQIKLPGALEFTAQGRVWLDGAPGAGRVRDPRRRAAAGQGRHPDHRTPASRCPWPGRGGIVTFDPRHQAAAAGGGRCGADPRTGGGAGRNSLEKARDPA